MIMKFQRLTTALLFTGVLLVSCSVNKAKMDNEIKVYFDENKSEGCFTMLNNSDGEITVYNMELDTARYAPGATFSMLNSLIALQSGAVTDEHMLVQWDSTLRSPNACNTNMNIKEAFGFDCKFFDQAIAKKIGKKSYQYWIDSVAYGNKNINGPVDSFWFNHQLKVSPDEQLGLLKKLYFGQLPFRKSVQESVVNMMLKEDNSAYKLYYKVASVAAKNNLSIGWVTGWVEENRHVYFFVSLIKNNQSESEISNTALSVTKSILKHYGFFQGKK